MTEAQEIALLALVSVALFIELAYFQRTRLGKVLGPVVRAILPQALFNPAPRFDSKELRALERRTSAKKRQANKDQG